MSLTFTKEGRELQFLLNNENWEVLFRMLNAFRYFRGYKLDSLQWLNLYCDMKDDFFATLMNAEPLNKIHLYKWFMSFLNTYEELKLTDLDIKTIKNALKRI